MIGYPYYNETIRQAVAVFGSLFNNIVIRRKDGTVVPVAIAYGPRSKWMEAHKELEADNEMFEKLLPRMSYEVVAMNYDQMRKITNKQKVIGKSDTSLTRVAAPVPYSLDFSLYIQTKNLNDGWQIVEQILPFFTPAYTVKVMHYPQDQDSDTPIYTNQYDMPFVLNAVTWVDDWTGDIGDRRVVEWTLEFNTKVWMSGPLMSSGSAVNGRFGKVILDSRAKVVLHDTPMNAYDSDIYVGDEVGYAALDRDKPIYADSEVISPDIINIVDSDGHIVKIIRNIGTV